MPPRQDSALRAFLGTLVDVRACEREAEALASLCEDVAAAVDWGLVDAPAYVDRRWLPTISAGLRDLIRAEQKIAGSVRIQAATRERALSHLHGWRVRRGEAAVGWLEGWNDNFSERPSLPALLWEECRTAIHLSLATWRLYRLLGRKLKGRVEEGAGAAHDRGSESEGRKSATTPPSPTTSRQGASDVSSEQQHRLLAERLESAAWDADVRREMEQYARQNRAAQTGKD